MWRETDSWFELRFNDESQGFAHLDSNGNYIGVYRADGTAISAEEHVEYTCTNDNATAPYWYVAPVVEPTPEA